MKNTLLILLLLISFFANAQSQSKLNEDAYNDYKKADKELNTTYQKILKEYKADAKFTAKLKLAQKAWIKFRDAEAEAQFPKDNKQLEYGSVFPMCWSITLKDLTIERTKKLMVWLNGIPEGDVCSGSVKNAN